MDQTSRIVDVIDEALGRFAARDLVSGSEVVDFLLDLRLIAEEADPLSRLLEEESQPAGA
ncbi:MAG: hypothetical protein KJ056_03475 [Acidimicrobiia bacterium]|nr:hypothetical protein [Acidimicrobiia bacterium]MCL4292079.1 hypothetical protein [Acidimicrobiia bacterium]